MDQLKVGDQLHAKHWDGNFYLAKVLVVSTSKSRAKAPVKVRFCGYTAADDVWVGLVGIRSKKLSDSKPLPDHTALAVGAKLQVEDHGVWYAAEVLQVSSNKKRAKAPVRVRFLGYDSTSEVWVGSDRIRSKLLTPKEEPLTRETVTAFVAGHLKRHKDLSLNAKDKLTADEIHGGNLNYAFVVRDESGGSLFVKQAPDFIKCLGKEAKLTRDRMRLEVQWYRDVAKIIGDDDARQYFPRIYVFDEKSMAFLMDFLGGYDLLQKTLFTGKASQEEAEAIGKAMGIMHSKSHSSKDAKAAARLTKVYKNEVLRGIQLEYVFSKCWREDERAAGLKAEKGFVKHLEDIKEIYKGGNTSNLSLCHGDLHCGSVMANGSKVSIIDPEFAVYGPPGLDVGSLLSTYIMAACSQTSQGKPAADIVNAMHVVWRSYSEAMKANGICDESIKATSQETAAFAGCEAGRTALGLAYERSLKIEDKELKAKAELAVMNLAASIIKEREKGVENMLSLVRAFKL